MVHKHLFLDEAQFLAFLKVEQPQLPAKQLQLQEEEERGKGMGRAPGRRRERCTARSASIGVLFIGVCFLFQPGGPSFVFCIDMRCDAAKMWKQTRRICEQMCLHRAWSFSTCA